MKTYYLYIWTGKKEAIYWKHILFLDNTFVQGKRFDPTSAREYMLSSRDDFLDNIKRCKIAKYWTEYKYKIIKSYKTKEDLLLDYPELL